MIELLNKKLELIEDIKKITENILYLSIEDEYEAYSELLHKRLEVIEQIDKLNGEISPCDAEETKSYEHIKNKMNSALKEILSMDEKIKTDTINAISEIKDKFSDVEKKMQTADYTLDEDDKKPSGYFLNKKG